MTVGHSADDLARAALSHYHLPPGTGMAELTAGLTTTYRIRAGDQQLVLRLHRAGYRTADHTRAELAYLDALGDVLGDTGVTVPRPVPDRDGDLVVDVTEHRHCDLLTWVDGEAPRLDDGLGADAVRQLGRAIGLVHDANARIALPSGLPRWDAQSMFTAAASPYRPLLEIDEILSAVDRADYAAIAAATGEIFAELGSDFGVVHFDFILGNTHLSRQGSEYRVGIFDFADCGLGYYLYDLCPMLGNLAGYPAGTYNPGYPTLRDALLSGYRSARALPVAWERHLPMLMAARHASHCLLTAGLGVSPTPRADAAWRMDLARLSLRLPV